jgi:hypothetical protein
VKFVELTVAVQVAVRLPRPSVTVTFPRLPVKLRLPVEAVPRLAVDGWLMLSDPPFSVNVPAVAADADGAVNARAPSPRTAAGTNFRKKPALPRMQ